MAQVAIQGSAKTGDWSSTTTPTVDTPAGSAGHQQLLVMTWDAGSSVSAPSISGWTLAAEEFQSGSANRLAAYTRVLSSAVSAGTASVTFSASTYGQYVCVSLNGVLGTVTLDPLSWSENPEVPATSSPADDSLHLVGVSSCNWPRLSGAVSGYTSVYNNYKYTASQGTSLCLFTKDVASGSVAKVTFPLKETDGTTTAGDDVNYFSVVAKPFLPTLSAAGTQDITARSAKLKATLTF